jgi:hypothetical protein
VVEKRMQKEMEKREMKTEEYGKKSYGEVDVERSQGGNERRKK